MKLLMAERGWYEVAPGMWQLRKDAGIAKPVGFEANYKKDFAKLWAEATEKVKNEDLAGRSATDACGV